MATTPWLRQDGDNLTSLADLNESRLLECIQKRYKRGIVYTDVGDILVAVNPFQQLPIYNESWSKVYAESELSHLSPHIYCTASRAFTALVHSKKNQVCVISGESGAGKTESTKLIIQQIMNMCKSSQFGRQLQSRIIQLNPVLEAFGNAQTSLNNNSSRFGKFIQLMFTSQGRIIGAGIEQYLLEKSRVCRQGHEERNFHIFYYLFAGLPTDQRKLFRLENPKMHRYLSAYKDIINDCNSNYSRDSFYKVLKNMEEIGFVDSEIKQVLAILAAVLHIGDIEFISGDSNGDSAVIKNTSTASFVANILSLESVDDLTFALTTLRTATRGETVDKQYSPSKAADVRDAMAKALYSRMFHWLVARINNYLCPKEDNDQHISIGILDIFGFENFQRNSFEQFCINLANEQLQQYFNTQIFVMEKEELEKEELDVFDITYQDNQPVLELFLSRPIGLISLLDEQCRTNGKEDVLLQRYKQVFKGHSCYEPHRGNALIFTVKHYAGNVEYEAVDFLDKNRDSLPDPVQGVLKFSTSQLVRVLFTKYPNFSGAILRSTIMKPSQRSVMKKMSVRGGRKKSMVGRRGHRIMTVSGHFRESLHKLMERLFAASPHFVRCIKPNLMKLPNSFDNEFVLKQLRYTGMLEAVRVRKEGFAYRPFFSDFVRDYRTLAFPFTDTSVKLTRESCLKILDKADLSGWKMGRSRVFLRYYHAEQLNRSLQKYEDSAILIQKIYRGYVTYKRYKPLQKQQKLQKLKVKTLLEEIQQSSNDLFGCIVDLNRDDVLNALERFGRPDPPPVQEEEEEEKGDKKFKPKAIGAVQVLVNSPVIAQKLLKPVERDVSPPTTKIPPKPAQKPQRKKNLTSNLDRRARSVSPLPVISNKTVDTKRNSDIRDNEYDDEYIVMEPFRKDSLDVPKSTRSHPLSPQLPTQKPQPRIKRPVGGVMILPNSCVKTKPQVQPRKTSIDQVPPHKTSIDQVSPRKTSIDQVPPRKTSMDQESPCKTSVDQVPPRKTSMDQESPCKTSVDQVPPRKTSVDQIPPRKTSVDQVSPHKTSMDQVPPRKTSVDQVSPHKTSMDQVPPRKTSVDQVSPHKTSMDNGLSNGIHIASGAVKSFTIQINDDDSKTDDDDNDTYYVIPPQSRHSSSDDEYIYPFTPLPQQQKRIPRDYANSPILPPKITSSESEREESILDSARQYRTLFTSRTVRVTDTNATNLTKGLSTSVPNLVEHNVKRKPKITTSTEDINTIGLSLDTPAIHRISQLPKPRDIKSSNPSNGGKKNKLGKLFKRKKRSPPTRSDVVATEFKFEKPIQGAVDPLGSQEVPGYLPGISDQDAKYLLFSQPKGSYLFYTGYSKSGDFIFKLAVSQGEVGSVWTCDIETEHSIARSITTLYLVSDTEYNYTFTNLWELTTYYRSHALNKADLKLTDACLSAKEWSTEQMRFTKKKPVPLPTTIAQIRH